MKTLEEIVNAARERLAQLDAEATEIDAERAKLRAIISAAESKPLPVITIPHPVLPPPIPYPYGPPTWPAAPMTPRWPWEEAKPFEVWCGSSSTELTLRPNEIGNGRRQ